MNYQEEKIARKEYETVKVGKPNYTYDDFLKEYYPADYKAQKQAKRQTPKLQFTVSQAPTLTPVQPKKPAVKIETPTMSPEERIAEGEAGKPIQLTLDKPKPQLKSEQERKSQEVSNKNYQQKEAAYHAQVQKTQEENRQKEMEAQKQREQNARNAAVLIYPSNPEMQSWAKSYLMEQGFDEPAEKANLNIIKTQVDNAYHNHTTGNRQEEKHAEVAQEHKRRTDEAAEQKRKAEEEAAQKKEAEAQRRAALDQKYDKESPSYRMANRLFPDDPTYAEEFAQELQRQHYDDHIRNNYIDIDDSTQWDEKSVRTMSDHLHRFFVKKDYKDFEAKQLADQLAGKAITFSGVPVIHDREYIEGSEHGEVERTAKQNHNAYAAEKLANSATTAGEAYGNQLTKDARQLEGVFDQWREKLFGRDDLFNARQVEEAEKARAERAEKEHPMATVAGKATVELIKSAAGKAFPLEDVLPLAGKAGQAIVKMLDAMPSTVRSVAEEVIISAPEVFLEGAYEEKEIGEIFGDLIDDAGKGVFTKKIAEMISEDKYDWVAEAGINTLSDFIQEQKESKQQSQSYLEPLLHQDIVQAEKAVGQQFPDIPKDYLLYFTGALRGEMEKLTESPHFQMLDKRTQQKKIEETEAKVIEQFWPYYRRQMGY